MRAHFYATLLFDYMSTAWTPRVIVDQTRWLESKSSSSFIYGNDDHRSALNLVILTLRCTDPYIQLTTETLLAFLTGDRTFVEGGAYLVTVVYTQNKVVDGMGES